MHFHKSSVLDARVHHIHPPSRIEPGAINRCPVQASIPMTTSRTPSASVSNDSHSIPLRVWVCFTWWEEKEWLTFSIPVRTLFQACPAEDSLTFKIPHSRLIVTNCKVPLKTESHLCNQSVLTSSLCRRLDSTHYYTRPRVSAFFHLAVTSTRNNKCHCLC